VPCKELETSSAGLRMRVNLRRKPWSVPRLRGRGEQEGIVMQNPISSALYRRICLLAHPRARINAAASSTVSLAHHSLVPRPREGTLHGP